MRWFECSDSPLDVSQIRDSRHTDPAVAPGLAGDPLDRVVAVQCLFLRNEGRNAAGIPDTARIHIHHRIPTRHPKVRIRPFEHRVGSDILFADSCRGESANQILQRALVLPVRAPGQEGRHRLLRSRSEDIRVDTRAVAERDGDVTLDEQVPFDRALETRHGAPEQVRTIERLHEPVRLHRSSLLVGSNHLASRW